LTLKSAGANCVEIDPFPFDANGLRVQLILRRLGQNKFADPSEFREAYFKATPEALDFIFVSR